MHQVPLQKKKKQPQIFGGFLWENKGDVMKISLRHLTLAVVNDLCVCVCPEPSRCAP